MLEDSPAVLWNEDPCGGRANFALQKCALSLYLKVSKEAVQPALHLHRYHVLLQLDNQRNGNSLLMFAIADSSSRKACSVGDARES